MGELTYYNAFGTCSTWESEIWLSVRLSSFFLFLRPRRSREEREGEGRTLGGGRAAAAVEEEVEEAVCGSFCCSRLLLRRLVSLTTQQDSERKFRWHIYSSTYHNTAVFTGVRCIN